MLHLSGSPSVASTVLPYSSLAGIHNLVLIEPRPFILLTVSVMRAEKSCKTCLTDHIQSILHHIMPLVINALGVDMSRQTDTHTDVQTQAISRN